MTFVSLVLLACGGGSGGSDSKDDTPPQLTYYSTYSSEYGQCSHVASENSDQAAQWVGAGGSIGKCPTNDIIAYCANLPADPRVDFQIYYYSSTMFEHSILAQGCEHLGGTYTQGSPISTGPDDGNNTDQENPVEPIEQLVENAHATGYMNFVDTGYISQGRVWNISTRRYESLIGGEQQYFYYSTNELRNSIGHKLSILRKPDDGSGTPLMSFNHVTGSLTQVSDTRWGDDEVCIIANNDALFVSEKHDLYGCWNEGSYGFYIDPLADSSWQPVSIPFTDIVIYSSFNRLTDLNGNLKAVLNKTHSTEQIFYLYENNAFVEYELNFTGETEEYGEASGFMYIDDSNILIKFSGNLYRFTLNQIKNAERGADITGEFTSGVRNARELILYPSGLGNFIRAETYDDEGTYHEYYDLNGTLQVSVDIPQNGTSYLLKTAGYNVVASIAMSHNTTSGAFMYYTGDWEPIPAAGLSVTLSSDSCVFQGTDSYAVTNGSTVTVIKGFTEYVKTNSQLIVLEDAATTDYGPRIDTKFIAMDLTNGDLSVFDEAGTWNSGIGRVPLNQPINMPDGCHIGIGLNYSGNYVILNAEGIDGFIHGNLDAGQAELVTRD